MPQRPYSSLVVQKITPHGEPAAQLALPDKPFVAANLPLSSFTVLTIALVLVARRDIVCGVLKKAKMRKSMTSLVEISQSKSWNKIVSQNVRLLRIEIGITQEAMGIVLGISYQQYQNYETGHNRISLSAWALPRTVLVNIK